MNTSWLWRLTAGFAVLSTLLLLFGLGYAVHDVIRPAAADDRLAKDPSEANGWKDDDGILDIVALGDSLTKGMGDETGQGYIGAFKTMFEEQSGIKTRLLNNLAVNGYRTDQLLADLDKPSVIDALKRADLIVFTIGGNDLFKFAREQLDLSAATITAEELLRSIPEPSERLERIFQRLHEIHPEAAVAYVGLYNPFLDLDPSRDSSRAIAEWNAKAASYVYAFPNAVLVPTADLFERNLLRYLYSDHFHPNTQGYKRIAERLVQALE